MEAVNVEWLFHFIFENYIVLTVSVSVVGAMGFHQVDSRYRTIVFVSQVEEVNEMGK